MDSGMSGMTHKNGANAPNNTLFHGMLEDGNILQ
jgi:hypothetical protein